jgi:hypothetical protein
MLTLVAILDDTRHPGAAISAAGLILERAYGKAVQPVAGDSELVSMQTVRAWQADAHARLAKHFGLDGHPAGPPRSLERALGLDDDGRPAQPKEQLSHGITGQSGSTVSGDGRILGGDNDRPPVQDTSVRGPIIIDRPAERPRWPRA